MSTNPSDITLVRDLLHIKGRDDLAYLLLDATGEIHSLHQYGSHWNSFLAQYVITTPPGDFSKLQQLSKDDYTVLLETICDVHPPQENSPEITTLRFCVRADNNPTKTRANRLALSWRQRALTKQQEAKRYLMESKYAESISASQECLELSLKALLLFIRGDSPKRHDIKSSDIQAAIFRLPPYINKQTVVRLFFYTRFWLHFYTIAKYGLEEFHTGPEHFLTENEAHLALTHTQLSIATIAEFS